MALPPLPYEMDALAPHVSHRTVEVHYTKHHAGYFSTLQSFCQGTPYAQRTLEEVILHSAQHSEDVKIFNNAAQVWNHSFYWHSMCPQGGMGQEQLCGHEIFYGALLQSFGSHEAFVQQWKTRALGQFGSGWVWLMARQQGELFIETTGNAQVPWLQQDALPLLVMDVWEHAYYLDYENRRIDYTHAWLHYLANGTFASQRYMARANNDLVYPYVS